MGASITIKRGDTIRWPCLFEAGSPAAPVVLTGYTFDCDVRRTSDRAIGATLAATIGNQITDPGTFELYLADSTVLTPGAYIVDIRYLEPDSDSYATESFALIVEEEVTTR